MRMWLSSKGCPTPYMEAVIARLAERQMAAAAADDRQSRSVVLVYCDSEQRWAELAGLIEEPGSTVVAILPELDVGSFARALSAGADGAVHAGTPSLIAVEALVAAVHGEVLLPQQAAHAIARLAHRQQPETELDEVDQRLLRGLAAGVTIQSLAEELHYSERTIRRHLQNLYLRLGVRNRAEATALAGRLDLND